MTLLVPALAATLFASAFLLFWCQPMVGKMVLPLLGGAASVWTTCLVFFQAMLLAGYVYAYLVSRISDIRKQIAVHGVILLAPLLFLPIRFSTAPSTSSSEHPVVWLLLRLITSVGVPFFVISTTAPLLQNWLTRTKDTSARDPYFLYSASNTGSLLALVVYPLVMEPRLGVMSQNRLWLAGYIVLLLMALVISGIVWRTAKAPYERPGSLRPPLQWKTRVYWIAAAFVPSGLMMAVTNHITANLASVPFLWIVPLAIYLLTFILAFARRFRVSSIRMSRLIPVVLLGVFPLVTAGIVAPPGLNWIVIGLHLLLLYCGALLCHAALAESRPDPSYLTEFYFWIALAGVLGGVFTAILAPLIFTTVLEYPLLVALIPFFRTEKKAFGNLVPPALLASAMTITWVIYRATGLDSNLEALAFAHTALLFACYKMKNHVLRFALSFAVLIAAYTLLLPDYIEGAHRLYAHRNFFGVKKVLEDPEARLRKFLHGDTLHGVESTEVSRIGEPLSYYHSTGPVGDVMEMMRARGTKQRFGVLGLGSGTMAGFGGADRQVTFYEIDPSVEPIARRYFTFLQRCGGNCDVVVGDGRLQISQAPDAHFDLMMLDAFSSDSIPTHLLSREALELYLSKLAPGGVLLFNVSNRYLNVEKLVSALVTDAGLTAYTRFDEAGDLRKEGKSNSNHLIAARRVEHLGRIATIRNWRRVTRPPGLQPWTDDYSNLLALIRWH